MAEDFEVGRKTINQTHSVFQGSAIEREIEKTHSPGYNHLPLWNITNWRYNPVTGQEIIIEDRHGRRMHSN